MATSSFNFYNQLSPSPALILCISLAPSLAILLKKAKSDAKMSVHGRSNNAAGKVVLKGRELSDKDFVRLGHALQNYPGLKGLEICLCDGISEEMIFELAKCFIKSSLNVLQLVHIGLGNKSANIIAAGIKGSPIRKLDLTFNRIGFEGAQMLAIAVKGSALHSLLLGRNEVGSKGAICLAQILQDSPNLKLLDLRMNGIDDDGILGLVDALPYSALESLQLDSNHISEGAASALLQSLSRPDVKLKSLSLAKNRLNDLAFVEIGCFANLQHIVLTSNELGDGAVAALATNTIPQSLHLEFLDLRNNPCISDSGVLEIIEAVKHHRSLRNILLNGTGVSQNVREELEAIIQALNSERARTMTILCSARHCPRLGVHATITKLPAELLRLLASML